jgi:hypothetical protein
MKTGKKAELSINIIIVAAIALLVLVIVSVIFMGRMGIFSKKSADCESVNGQCVYGDSSACGDQGLIKHPSAVCYDSNSKVDTYRVCCTSISS